MVCAGSEIISFHWAHPANRAGQGKQHREHGRREANRREDHTGIEIDIRIELLLDEIFVFEGNLFQLARHIEDRIVLTPSVVEHFGRGLLHDLRARIEILVDAVTEAHQAERIVLVLGALDKFGNTIRRSDFAQHVERRFIRTAMGRTPQASDAGSDTSERIGTRGTGQVGQSRWMHSVRDRHAG